MLGYANGLKNHAQEDSGLKRQQTIAGRSNGYFLNMMRVTPYALNRSDGRMDGRTDRRTDVATDRRIDGQTV